MLNKKRQAILKFAQICVLVVMVWQLLPALVAVKNYIGTKEKVKFASIGPVDYNMLKARFKNNFSYEMNYSLEDMMLEQSPSYPRWVAMTEEKVQELKLEIEKMSYELKYTGYFEDSYSYHKSEIEGWVKLLDQKLAIYQVKGEMIFGKDSLDAEREKYLKEKWLPQTKLEEFSSIYLPALNAIPIFLGLMFLYFLLKAKLYGFKLRFEILPHRAFLAAIISPAALLVDFYPYGSPLNQTKAMLSWTFGLLLYALTVGGAAISSNAQSLSKPSKKKDEYSLVCNAEQSFQKDKNITLPTISGSNDDCNEWQNLQTTPKSLHTIQLALRYNKAFAKTNSAQSQVRFTYFGKPEKPLVFEAVVTNSFSNTSALVTSGYKVLSKPATLNLVGGTRLTFAKQNRISDGASIVFGSQIFYRKPGNFRITTPVLSLEKNLKPDKHWFFNWNTVLLKEYKKWDYGPEIILRKNLSNSSKTQWTFGGVIGYQRNKKLPRFEFSVLKNWLGETRFRLALYQQFQF